MNKLFIVAAVAVGAVVGVYSTLATMYIKGEKIKHNDKLVINCMCKLITNKTIQDIPKLLKELSREGLNDFLHICYLQPSTYGATEDTWDQLFDIAMEELTSRVVAV